MLFETRMKSCRAPHGARGLKYGVVYRETGKERSRPARGAWIEISPFGNYKEVNNSRAPHGARGLKCGGLLHRADGDRSRPARGAWIEMSARPS